MEQMFTDSKLRSRYFEKIDEEVSKLKEMPREQFQNTVDDCVNKVFEGAYIERLQTMFDKSKEAQQLERRRMFLRLKRFLFRQRCIEYGTENYEMQLKRLENYSYKLPHCSESWEQSWRDVNHPYIEKSPLFHLSKAIGRATFSPVELTKEYLTNP